MRKLLAIKLLVFATAEDGLAFLRALQFLHLRSHSFIHLGERRPVAFENVRGKFHRRIDAKFCCRR